ncbi:hypothetical protein [Sphingosinicella sp. LY1275]|uniref:hypothetical protein n=1 Tax=Sphingosinicella sp. LY1275 TaxID=3095379 RepID=UPI002ADEF9F7|nr:hypothetical protein [Sphingosinicella sp. LY1275]MEA1013224.1 hypothetical protein [Sphingosinicella sp. LY1275]
MRRLAALAAMAMTAAAASAQSVAAPTPVPVQTPAQILAQDGAEYARRYAVPLAEALQRLKAQEESVAATDRLQQAYGDRLVGIAIEHRPAYRIVVLLTGDTPVADQSVSAGGLQVPVVFRTGAKATRAEIITAIRTHQAAIRARLPRPPGMGADPRTGELVVMIKEAEASSRPAGELEQAFAALTGVPVRIRIIDRDTDLAADGGARLEGVDPANGRRYICTTGFVVTDGTRTGVATAAHCPDEVSYGEPGRKDVPLEFVGQWGWAYRDVQIHASATPLQPLFFADSAKTVARPVVTWRNRESTRAGDFVCHRGERTGYSCGEVEMTDFAPAGDLCGGPCEPTWVTVGGPHCRSGDSGSPVFNGSVAFGILKGGSYRPDGTCNFYFYMSTDYLPEDWTLLHRGSPEPTATGGH